MVLLAIVPVTIEESLTSMLITPLPPAPMKMLGAAAVPMMTRRSVLLAADDHPVGASGRRSCRCCR